MKWLTKIRGYNITTFAMWLLIIAGALSPLLLFNFDFEIHTNGKIISSKAGEVGSWLAGTTGVLWGLASILLIYKSFELSRKQKDEDNFFNLMDTLHTITGSIEGEFTDDDGEDRIYSGAAFFSRFFRRLYDETWDSESYGFYWEQKDDLELPFACSKEEEEPEALFDENGSVSFKRRGNLTLKYVVWSYNSLYEPYHSQLGHFFRMVFNVIKHVDSSKNLNKEEKQKLINLIQAQLTNDQLGVIFYNILSGHKKFYKYVTEKYPDFFQNIDENSLIQKSDIQYYKKANPKVRFDYINYPPTLPQILQNNSVN